MKVFSKVIYVAWIIAAFAALFFSDELKLQLEHTAWVIVQAIACLQILFGCIINPIIKHYLQHQRDVAFRKVADVMLKSIVK
jgi:hypothetical protein